jgi:hypothetical protein
MAAVVERRLTLFADHPDPTRHAWVGFVEIMARYDDGRQAIDVHTLDDAYPTEAAALEAADAWVAQYKSAFDGAEPITIVRL